MLHIIKNAESTLIEIDRSIENSPRTMSHQITWHKAWLQGYANAILANSKSATAYDEYMDHMDAIEQMTIDVLNKIKNK